MFLMRRRPVFTRKKLSAPLKQGLLGLSLSLCLLSMPALAQVERPELEKALQMSNYSQLQQLLNPDTLNQLFIVKDQDNETHYLTPLGWAALNNRLELVKWLVETKKADVNALDRESDTALTQAVYKGHFEVARYLVEKGANVKAINSNGYSVLYWAAQGGNLELVKWLVETHKLDPNLEDRDGYNALSNAIYYGHLPVARYLVEKGAHLQAGFSRHQNLLQLAPKNGNLELLKWLIEEQKQSPLQRVEKLTPVYKAAEYGQFEMVKYLLSRSDAQQQLKIESQETLLMFAARSGNLELVKWLVESQGFQPGQLNELGENALAYAAYRGHVEVVKFLADAAGPQRNAVLRQTSQKAENLLHFASSGGNLELVKWLLEQGLPLDQPDAEGNTPLHHSIWGSVPEIILYLLEHGAKVSPDSSQDNLLINAIYNKQEELALTLLSRYPELSEQPNKWGGTPLLKAAEYNQPKLVEALLAKGANPKTTDHSNTNLLMQAALSGNLELTQSLQQRFGFDLRHQNQHLETVLHQAVYSGNLELAKWLVSQGADLQHVRYKATLLETAISSQHLHILKWLIASGQFEVDDLNRALVLAVNKSYLELGKTLLDQGAEPAMNKESLVLSAASNHNLPGLAFYLRHRPESARKWAQDPYHLPAIAQSSSNLSIQVLEYLIQQGLDPLAIRNYSAQNLLMMMAENGNMQGVQWLLKRYPALLTERDKEGNSPIFHAVRSHYPPMIELMLQHGFKLQEKNKLGETVLHQAAKTDNPDILKYLIETQQLDLHAEDDNLETPLSVAISKGNLASARYLVSKGAQLKQENSEGHTLVHQAFKAYGPDTLKYVLDELKLPLDPKSHDEYWALWLEAYPNKDSMRYVLGLPLQTPPAGILSHFVRNAMTAELKQFLQNPPKGFQTDLGEGSKAFEDAVRNGYIEMSGLLYQPSLFAKGQNLALVFAAEGNQPQMLQELLQKKIGDLEAGREYSQQTAVLAAAEKGSLEMLQLLHKAGARLQATDQQGKTALMYAASQNQFQVVDWLLSQKQDVNTVSHRGITALYEALANGHLQMARYLLSKGARLTGPQHEPLWFAAVSSGRLASLKFLSEKLKLDVTVRNQQGSDLLSEAVFAENPVIINWLLQQGLSPDQSDDNGTPAIFRAAERGNLYILKQLEAAGANLNLRDECNNTLLMAAVGYDPKLEVIDYLLTKKLSAKGYNCEQQTLLQKLDQAKQYSQLSEIEFKNLRQKFLKAGRS